MMTVALTEVERKAAVRFGVAQLEEVNGFDLIRGFTEKPDMKDIPERPTINAGIYVIDSDFILSNIDKYLPDKPNTSFEKNLLETLAKDKKSRLVAYILDLDAWFDVGTLEQLIDTNLYIASRKDVKRQKGPCDS
jgi:NDP-sugar pyrophosphorylase family protein